MKINIFMKEKDKETRISWKQYDNEIDVDYIVYEIIRLKGNDEIRLELSSGLHGVSRIFDVIELTTTEYPEIIIKPIVGKMVNQLREVVNFAQRPDNRST